MGSVVIAKFGGSTIGVDGISIPVIIQRISSISKNAKVIAVFSAPLTVVEGKRTSLTDVVLELGNRVKEGRTSDLIILEKTYEKILELVSSEFQDECKKIIDDCLDKVRIELEKAMEKKEFSDEIRSKTLAYSGEILMSYIMEYILQSQGIRSKAVRLENWPIITDNNIEYTNFVLSESNKKIEHLEKLLEQNQVITIGGFIGRTTDGIITTYERGGSDRTAADLGILLHNNFDVKIDFEKGDFVEPDVSLGDMYYRTLKKSLRGFNAKKIGLLVTINDNQQYLDPSPTVELIPRLALRKDVRAQNFQGLACSSFSESLLNSAGFFLMNGKDDAVVLIGTHYTPWFLDRIKQIKHISKKNKADFHNLIYFLIFSDITASVILSEKKTKNTQLQIDTESILTLKDTKNASKNATIKLSPDKKHRMIFDMKLDSQKLRQDVANLSAQNIKLLRKKTPSEFKKIKIWGLHTAGSRFVDYVSEKCQIDKTKIGLSYDLMKKTGNTGAVSSLQFINECVNKKELSKNQLGCFVDYGWEGVNLFMFKKLFDEKTNKK